MTDPYAEQQQPQAPVPPQSPPEFAPPMPVEARPPASPTDQGVGLSQDEMRSNLQGMLSQLTAKFAEAQSINANTTQEIKQQDTKMLGDLFDFFESIGVDPSNPDDVASFMEKLSMQNPELSQQLQSLLNRAMKKNSGMTPDSGEIPTDGSEDMQQDVPAGMPPSGQGMLG